ncbi:MAG: VWA domain-containing protein [Bacteroidia bacterium]|nr:VWA domain-containing protein [Bacteroidia bacterium]
MKNKKTYYQIILDQSGSMSDCIQPTISGFNEQLQLIQDMKEKFPEQEVVISLTTFNHEVTPLLRMVDPAQASELNRSTYRPAGMTALYDAIGFTVSALKEQAGIEIKDDKASAVIVVITDGYENSSRTFNYETIRNMIKELDNHRNWTFSYLGATLDAMEVARDLNINSRNAMVFDKADMAGTWEVLRDSHDNYMSEKGKGRVRKGFLKKKK